MKKPSTWYYNTLYKTVAGRLGIQRAGEHISLYKINSLFIIMIKIYRAEECKRKSGLLAVHILKGNIVYLTGPGPVSIKANGKILMSVGKDWAKNSKWSVFICPAVIHE